MKRTILRLAFRALVAFIFLGIDAFLVWACSRPSTHLTITYTWPPFSVVQIDNLGVNLDSVQTAASNWNFWLFYGTCYGPLFSNSSGSGQAIYLNYGPLVSPLGGFKRGETFMANAGLSGIPARLHDVDMTINWNVTQVTTITEVLAHEFGHTVGLGHCTGCEFHSSVMVDKPIPEGSDPWSYSIGLPGPNACDISSVLSMATDYRCSLPYPIPLPPTCPEYCEAPDEGDWGVTGPQDWCLYPGTGCEPGSSPGPGGCCYRDEPQSPCPENCIPMLDDGGTEPIDWCTWPVTGCPPGYTPGGTGCCEPNNSPILVDVQGDGFALTDSSSGVAFDINGDGILDSISWTVGSGDDAWLALDRNGNGTIDNGVELFGNSTPQMLSNSPNGFLALAVYDMPENGGNSDGSIDSQDAIFAQLRLWVDANHNGFSEPGELSSLTSLGLHSISLSYQTVQRVDQFGNRFKYRAKVEDARITRIGRWAWDVFLVKR